MLEYLWIALFKTFEAKLSCSGVINDLNSCKLLHFFFNVVHIGVSLQRANAATLPKANAATFDATQMSRFFTTATTPWNKKKRKKY